MQVPNIKGTQTIRNSSGILKALILLQSTMLEGKEFHALTELTKNELKKAEVLAKGWASCFSLETRRLGFALGQSCFA